MKIFQNNSVYLKTEFYSSVIREILNDAAVGSFMSSLILTLCCIDYMGIPLSNNTKNTRVHFKQFLKDYVATANPRYAEQRTQDVIYAIRCSMVHSFGESDATVQLNVEPMFEISGDSTNHLMETTNTQNVNCFHISIPHFVGEIVAGVEMFFRQTTDNNLLIGWYKKLVIMGGASGPLNLLSVVKNGKISYEQIHPFVDILNDPQSGFGSIAAYIADKILKRHNYIWTRNPSSSMYSQSKNE